MISFTKKLATLLLVAVATAKEFRLAVEADITHAVGRAPNWNRGERAAASEMVHPTFMLRHEPSNLKMFEQTLFDISTPGNPRYGKHLSRAEVAELLPPVDGAEKAVLSLLSAHGVSASDVGPDIITASMSVATAEAMFDTKLHHFKHETMGVDLIRASAPYTLPPIAADAVYLVGDLVQLPALDGVKAVDVEIEAPKDFPNGCGWLCKGKVTPAVLQQAYEFGDTPSGKNTSMAVAEFQGVSWDTRDLDHFTSTCHLKAPVKVDRQIGKNPGLVCKAPIIGGSLCLEALLDIQYMKVAAGDIPLTCISDSKYSLLNWAAQLQKMDDLPLVHSVSYGNDEVQQTSESFMQAVNAQFMKLGARGISILFASGDQGVYGRSGLTRDHKFHPDFPAASPYVTAVGGTDFAQKSIIGEEKAWASGGGGFSDTFPTPAYQKDAVAGYLSAASSAGVLPDTAHFNSSGRGYPDVSALGGQQNPYCVSGSLIGIVASMMGVAGTSASCPVVAGLFARLNALRADKGMPPMGFLNPFIYKNPEAFNDVSLGKNHANGPEGFTAIKGWDAATGFGTPNFPKLVKAAISAMGPDESVVVV